MNSFTTMNTEAHGETSDDILDEFFGGGGQFQQVRTKAMRRPGRSPVKQALQSLNTSSTSEEAMSTDDSQSVSSKRQKQGGKKKSSKQQQTRPPRPVKSEKEVKELHLEDRNVVSDLIHRVTQLSGLEPGAARITETPPNMQERAAAMPDLQFKAFMDPTEQFQDTIATIVQVHKDIGDLAQNVFYFRQALGRDLKHLNSIFIKHFQLLISEILTMHRNKFKSQTETVNALLHRLDVLEKEAVERKERMGILQSSKETLEDENKRISALCTNKDATIKILQDELLAQEAAQKEFLEMLERQKVEEAQEREKRKEQDKYMLMQERNLLLRQRQDLQAELMRQNALLQESVLLQNNKAQSEKKKIQDNFKPVHKKCESSTQTEYDDFGAWDRQSGWTLPISGTVKARNRWRRALLYGSCPSCRGVGNFMSAAAAQYKHLLRGEVMVDNSHDIKIWRIPDQIIRFISNIPRAIQAEKLHDTKWVLRHVWNFFEFKMKTDANDISSGQPLQMFSDFLIDTFLQRCERRVDAEIYLYLFLKSLQSCLAKKKNPLLHTFARFLGVFGTTDEEDDLEVVSSIAEITVASCKMSSKEDGSSHSKHARAHTHTHNDKEKDKLSVHKKVSVDKKSFVNKAPPKVTVENTHVKVPNTNLPCGILDVYIRARSCMLLPYTGMFASGIEAAKEASTGYTNLNKNQSKLEGFPAVSVSSSESSSSSEEAMHWNLSIPPHLCISDTLTAWVPIDRALEVSTAVLGFLSERQMLALNRQIEHEAMFLTKAGVLEEPEGSHSVIRAVVRRILKHLLHGENKAEDKAVDEADHQDHDDTIIIVVNLEKVLQATVQQLSTRISFVETRLKRLFAEGDDNGDGELSFREFQAVVTQVAPHFSTRTQLKMFREALMSGNDNSVITEHSFVVVCRKYGLVKLVDIEHLQHSMVKQPSPSNDPGSKDHPAGVHRRKASIIAPPSAPLKEKQHTEATTVQQGQSEELPPSLKEAHENCLHFLEAKVREMASQEAAEIKEHEAQNSISTCNEHTQALSPHFTVQDTATSTEHMHQHHQKQKQNHYHHQQHQQPAHQHYHQISPMDQMMPRYSVQLDDSSDASDDGL